MQTGHNNHLAPVFVYNFPKFANFARNHTLVKENKFTQYKENKHTFFSSMTIPETPLQDSDEFQLVTNRQRKRQILQTLAAEDNDPVPDENIVFSNSDGK